MEAATKLPTPPPPFSRLAIPKKYRKDARGECGTAGCRECPRLEGLARTNPFRDVALSNVSDASFKCVAPQRILENFDSPLP